MPTVYTIEGHGKRKGRKSRKSSASGGSGRSCKMVKTRGRGCKIELCRGSTGRWKFQKGTRTCT